MNDRLQRLAAWLLVPLLLVLGSLGRVCWCGSLHGGCEEGPAAARTASSCCDSGTAQKSGKAHEASPDGECCCFGTSSFLDQAPGGLDLGPALAQIALPPALLGARAPIEVRPRSRSARLPDRQAGAPPLRVLHCTYRI